MAILLPHRWTKQPTYPVRVRSLWMQKGVVFAFLGSLGRDMIRYGIPTRSGTITRGTRYGDQSTSFDSASAYLDFGDNDAYDITGALSCLWVGGIDAVGGWPCIISKWVSAGAGPYDCFIDSSNLVNMRRYNAAGSANNTWTSNGSIAANRRYTLGFLFPSVLEGTPSIYIDGTKQTLSKSGTATGACATTSTGLRLGSRDGGFTTLDGFIECCVLSNQQWTEAEYLALLRAPYGELFEPIKRRIYFDVGAAGGSPLNITGIVGTASAAGIHGNVDKQRALLCTVGGSTALGRAANINAQLSLLGVVGLGQASGAPANVDRQRNISGTVASGIAAGSSAVIDRQLSLLGSVNPAAAGGISANISTGSVLNCGVGTALSSNPIASIDRQLAIVCSSGTAVASGHRATIVQGTPTLTEQDIQAIVAAVWADPRALTVAKFLALR